MHSRSLFRRWRVLISVALLPLAAVAGEGYRDGVKVATLLKTSTDAAGQPIRYPAEVTPELTTLLVDIPAGQETGWHVHSQPCVAYVLDGEVAVETAGGKVRQFKAGDSFAEVVNLAHCGRTVGPKPVKILLLVIGGQGTPVSQKVEPPPRP